MAAKQSVEGKLDFPALTAPLDLQHEWGLAHNSSELPLLELGHRFAIDAHDPVARLHPGPCCNTILDHLHDPDGSLAASKLK